MPFLVAQRGGTVTVSQRQGGGVQKEPQGGLAEVLDLILDKGLVIDAFVKVSLVGIELITIDARIVVASVDTYLKFAEATNRLDLHAKGGKDLGEFLGGATEGVTQGGAKGKTKGVLDAGKEKWDEVRGERQSQSRRDKA
ncbi:putative gas vesicle structural protein 1 [Actinomycetospora sp. NBRC 106375]|nr:putative gas vesicle structural protein 1 [Actinomycetospora sp. NBRC 106375]